MKNKDSKKSPSVVHCFCFERIKILNWIFAGYLAEGAAWLRSHRGVRSLAILYALIDFAEEKQLSDVLLREEDLLKPMIKLIARVLYSLDKEVMNMVVSYLVSKNTTLTSVLTTRISALLGEKENGVILESNSTADLVIFLKQAKK